ncbi:MAG: helix-turn-helix domain-containing protein [Akkermansiaceae bacterium]
MSRPPTPTPFHRQGDRLVHSNGTDLLDLAESHNFSVKKVAAEFDLTVIQLQRHVENAIGLKPKDLFCNHRALLAKRMISDGENLHDVSEKLGYLYYSHFCTDIKKFYGISPKQLEKKLRPS